MFGVPTETYWVNDADGCNKDPLKTAQLIEELIEKDYFVGGGIGFVSNSDKEKYGLVGHHAYSYHGVCYVNFNGNSRYPLIKVRNPWGSTEWKLNFSDYDNDNWSDANKNACNYDQDVEDGYFHIPAEDFVDWFGDISTGFMIDNYVSTNKLVEGHTSGTISYDIEIEEDGQCFLGV